MSPRRFPARVGLVILIDLVQDAELLLPAALRARDDPRFEVRVIVTEWLDHVAPAIPARVKEALGFSPLRVMRHSLLTRAAPQLRHWDALLTGSESTAAPHRFAHALAERANRIGLETFTVQHGLENVGLTYRGDGDHSFASRHLLTWGEPASLPAWVSPDVRERCIGVGRPATASPSGRKLPLDAAQKPLIAVFENLHWERYDEDYRARFLRDLTETAAANEDALFLVKPHPAGQWLVKQRSAFAPRNLLIADPNDPDWCELGAADIIAHARAVITTPSTIALDAALQDRPVAVTGYGLDLDSYAPLPIIADQNDWRDFVAAACAHEPDARPQAFLRGRVLEGDACGAILDAIAARSVQRSVAQPTLRSRVADKAVRLIRSLPEPAARFFPRRLFERGAIHPLAYERWIKRYDTLTEEDRTRIAEIAAHWGDEDRRISVIVDASKASAREIERTLACLREQLAMKLEIFLVGAAHADGIPAASLRESLQRANAPFAAVLEAGDVIAPHALFTLAGVLRDSPDAAFAYSDEDWIDDAGKRRDPYFKPDWNLDLFLGQDFASRLALFRVDAARRAGGFRDDDAILYDLLLRLGASCVPILHAPFVLHHRRAQALEAQSRAAQAQAASRQLANAGAAIAQPDGAIRVRHALPTPAPAITAIVPTKDQIDLVRTCVDGLRMDTDYDALEIVIVDNQSTEAATQAYFSEVERAGTARVSKYPHPFNFAAINNEGAKAAGGELLALINNDIRVVERGWLKEMAALAMREDVGAVGAMLIYPGGAIQHAGCVLGIGGVAAHPYLHWPASEAGPGGRLRATQEVSAVTAACLVTRRSVWDAMDGMDEELPVAFNDIDYCLRVRAAGLKVLWTPFAVLEHHESASRGSDQSGARRARLERDKAFMRARWGATLLKDAFYNPNLSLAGTDAGLAFPPRITFPWRDK